MQEHLKVLEEMREGQCRDRDNAAHQVAFLCSLIVSASDVGFPDATVGYLTDRDEWQSVVNRHSECSEALSYAIQVISKAQELVPLLEEWFETQQEPAGTVDVAMQFISLLKEE